MGILAPMLMYLLACQEAGSAESLIKEWADARFWIVSKGTRIGWQHYRVSSEDYQGARSLRVDYERANSRFWGQRYTAWLKLDETLTPLEIRWAPGWTAVRIAKGLVDADSPFAKPAPANLALFPEFVAALLPMKEGSERPFSYLSLEDRAGHKAGPLKILGQEAIPGTPAGSVRAWKVACPLRQAWGDSLESWETMLWIRGDRTLAASTSTIRYTTWDGKPRVFEEGLVPMKPGEWDSPAMNETVVAAQICLLADMSRMLRAYDLDGNTKNDCWTGDISGLFRLVLPKEKEPIRLISREVAMADAAPLAAGAEGGGGRLVEVLCEKPVPFHGYFFKMLRKGWEEGGAIPLNDGSNHHPHAFAICAYPLGYGTTGRQTFLISHYMDLYSKDLKGQSVEAVPADLEKEGWRLSGPRR